MQFPCRLYRLICLNDSAEPPTLSNHKQQTLVYARVSSHDQKNDLDRQVQVLENFCSVNGWSYEDLPGFF